MLIARYKISPFDELLQKAHIELSYSHRNPNIVLIVSQA
jgi:hypothetical protein